MSVSTLYKREEEERGWWQVIPVKLAWVRLSTHRTRSERVWIQHSTLHYEMSGSHPGFIRDYVWHRPLNPLSIKLCVWPLYTVTGYWLLINLLVDQFTTILNITTGNKCIIFGLPDLVWLVMWIIERQFSGSRWKMKEVSGMQHGSHHNYVIIQLFIKCDRQCRNTAQYIVLISD